MWDLKLWLSDFFFNNVIWLVLLVTYIGECIHPFFFSNFTIIDNISAFYFVQNSTFFTALKFVIVVMFLILIRGGTPRYRYDYLTKLGWLKFLGFIILLFLTSIFFYFLF